MIKSSTSTNTSSDLSDFNQQLSKYAKIRENILAIIINLPYMNSDILKMQASTLAKLTEATNQLTRDTCVNNIFDFSFHLYWYFATLDTCID